MIPPRSQLPKSWKKLKNYTFDLPFLAPNDPSSCPRSLKDILEYLAVEAPGGSQAGSENVVPFDLYFIRTALGSGGTSCLWGLQGTACLDGALAVQHTH